MNENNGLTADWGKILIQNMIDGTVVDGSASECRFSGCSETDVCDGCGYCEIHHYVSVVDRTVEHLQSHGKQAVLRRTKDVGQMPDGTFIVPAAAIIACLSSLLEDDEDRPFGEDRLAEIREQLYRFMSLLFQTFAIVRDMESSTSIVGSPFLEF